MAAVKRLQFELGSMQTSDIKSFRNITADETNIHIWQGLVVPDTPPYDKGAFRVEITFPTDYPFKPPVVNFLTQIYHPNVDDKGLVCLPIISSENWKPATKIEQVIEALVALVNVPEPDHPLRAEVAEEYIKDRETFNKKAEEFTQQHSEQIPTD